MATLNATYLTMLDWAKGMDPKGAVAKTIEILTFLLIFTQTLPRHKIKFNLKD